MSWTPNRIVALGGSIVGLGVAGLAVGAEISGPQAAGLVAGAAVVLKLADRFLVGWQKWEARQGEADQPVSWEDLLEQVRRVDDPDVVAQLSAVLAQRRTGGANPAGR
jgi:hypothetical protein